LCFWVFVIPSEERNLSGFSAARTPERFLASLGMTKIWGIFSKIKYGQRAGFVFEAADPDDPARTSSRIFLIHPERHARLCPSGGTGRNGRDAPEEP
jgi:hypothetical protein